jgi:transcriptional regulator with XRE-family HTH domain
MIASIKHRMLDKGNMTVTDLASQIGFSRPATSQVINGSTYSLAILTEIARVLDLDIEKLSREAWKQNGKD